MKVQLTLLLLLFSQFIIGQNIRYELVLFETAKWQLNSSDKQQLDGLVKGLEENSQYKIDIKGHTDDVGDSQYNIQLSKRRSDAVSKYLIGAGIDRGKMSIAYFGEENPKEENSSESGRQWNRRVEITLTISPEIGEKDLVGVPKYTMEDLYEQLRPPAPKFCYNMRRDTVIVGAQGTIMYFRANSFNLNPDTLTDCIEITFKEVFKKSDMILENLSTMSDGNILISQSMLYINATYKGNQLEMTKDITVFSPTDTILPDMRLFTGQRDPHGNMNWTGAGNPAVGITGRLFQPCDTATTLADIRRCKFFFCKIKKFMKKVFPKKEEPDSTMGMSPIADGDNGPCGERKKKLKDFLEKFGDIPVDKLKDIPQEDLRYYVFNRRLGWTNLDWMAKIGDRVYVKVAVKPEINLDFKIVFQSQRTIIPLLKGDGFYYFQGAPNGYKVWLVGLRFVDGIPELALEEHTLGSMAIENVNFQVYSIDEMREKLKVLDQ